MPKVFAVIPARFDSTRFPGKPLVDLKGKPMIQRVWEQACKAKAVDCVAIATDDKRIALVAEAFGADVVMTPRNCPSGSDRVARALKSMGAKASDLAVNVQGDEPMLPPKMIDQLVALLKKNPKTPMATLMHPLQGRAEWANPNIVKALVTPGGKALYFSRASLQPPRAKMPRDVILGRHIGLYAYRVSFLNKLLKLAPTPLEKELRLEQMRVLENGYELLVGQTRLQSEGIDTPADAARVRRRIRP